MLSSFWIGFLAWLQGFMPFLYSSTIENPVVVKDVQQIESGNNIQKLPSMGVRRLPTYEGQLRDIRRLIEHGYYAEASTELSRLSYDYPEKIEPFFYLADILVRRGDTAGLSSLVDRIATRFPDHTVVRILQGRLALLTGFAEYNRFVADLDVNTLPPQLRVYQAFLWALQNNHEKAQSVLQPLLSFEVNDEPRTSDEYQQTISSDFYFVVERILQEYESFSVLSEGKRAHLFALLGKVAGDVDETRIMRAFADLALKEDMSYIDAWILRGYSHFLEENYQKALPDFYEAYRLDPVRPQTAYFLALSLMHLERNKEAIVLFEKALEYGFPFSEDVDWKLMEVFLEEGKFDMLIPLYEKYITIDVPAQKITTAFHTLIDKANRSDVAVDIGQRLVEARPTSVFHLNMYAWALIADSQFEESSRILDQADQSYENHPQTALNRGLLYETQGDMKNAQEWYRKSYEMGSKIPEFVSLANFAARQYNRLVDMPQ